MEPVSGSPKRPKQPTQMQIIKRKYLPLVIGGVALVVMAIFIIGAYSRNAQRQSYISRQNLAAASAREENNKSLAGLAETTYTKAKALVDVYDYDGALSCLEEFSGAVSAYPKLAELEEACNTAKSSLTLWNDPDKVPHFSTQMLIADTSRAFSHAKYGSSYKKNFITTAEFSAILEQLYNRGYVLVSPYDVFQANTTEGGSVNYTAGSIWLPEGKKPFILTQTNVNYYAYMIDGNGDKKADKDGSGFANKLVLQNGDLLCSYVDASGSTLVGDYDLVPILNHFIDTHPGFSYKGARAVLALTGDQGLLGYRTNPETKASFGEDVYNQDCQDVKAVIEALKTEGYVFACYTYSNAAYGALELVDIQSDQAKWQSQVEPYLGKTDMLVFAKNSDIDEDGMYTGNKFTALQGCGYSCFFGFSTDGKPSAAISSKYIRQARLLLTGENLKNKGDWFTEYFEAGAVLDGARG